MVKFCELRLPIVFPLWSVTVTGTNTSCAPMRKVAGAANGCVCSRRGASTRKATGKRRGVTVKVMSLVWSEPDEKVINDSRDQGCTRPPEADAGCLHDFFMCFTFM